MERTPLDFLLLGIFFGIFGAFLSLIISTAYAIFGYIEWGSILVAVANCTIATFVFMFGWGLVGVGFGSFLRLLVFIFRLDELLIKLYAAVIAVLGMAFLFFLVFWLPIRTSEEKSFIWQWEHLYSDVNSCESHERSRPTKEPDSNGYNTFPAPWLQTEEVSRNQPLLSIRLMAFWNPAYFSPYDINNLAKITLNNQESSFSRKFL